MKGNAMFAKGTKVRKVIPDITGEIDERRLNDEAGEMEYHVQYTGADGEPAARWFLESELQEDSGVGA